MNQLGHDQSWGTIRGARPFSLLLLTALLLLLACGGSEETTDAAPAESADPAPTNTPAPTAAPVPEPTKTAGEHLESGREFAEVENFDAAIEELQAALDLEPDNVDVLAALGGVLLSQEKYAAAVVELNKALSIDAGHPLALSNLCGGLGIQGTENAVDICQQAVFLNPNDADAYNGLGIAYGQQGQFEEAIAAFLEAIQLEPEHNWAHNNLGRTYINMERFDEGIVELSEAIRITPDNANAHYNLGLAYANLEQYEEAIPAYKEALRLDPNLVLTHIDLAVVYTRLGQPEEAIASFETYLELVPNADNREAIAAEIVRLGATSIAVVDYANPAAVVQAVFSAAATGDYVNLSGLCDPLGENDGDTALICEITTGHANENDFIQIFANGRINGDVIINGERAELPFLFGPAGDQQETMILILRDGRWYLLEF